MLRSAPSTAVRQLQTHTGRRVRAGQWLVGNMPGRASNLGRMRFDANVSDSDAIGESKDGMAGFMPRRALALPHQFTHRTSPPE